jgi:ammonium transporter, Amt family
MLFKSLQLLLLLFLLSVTPAFAADQLDTGDTAWMIVATALVMMMTPGRAGLFYGGLSRYKNLLNTYAMIFAAYCLASVIWVVWGYSLAFGTDGPGMIGGFDYMLLRHRGGYISGTFPICVCPVSNDLCRYHPGAGGRIGGRPVTFRGLDRLLDSLGHAGLLPCGSLGLGWRLDGEMGALDFAGGTVVHINAGVAGLVLALVLGKRIGYGKEAMFPSSVALTALGAGLLWFGWFGFNAGSQLAADGLAGSAFLVTNTSAAMGALAWMFAEWGAR